MFRLRKYMKSPSSRTAKVSTTVATPDDDVPVAPGHVGLASRLQEGVLEMHRDLSTTRSTAQYDVLLCGRSL